MTQDDEVRWGDESGYAGTYGKVRLVSRPGSRLLAPPLCRQRRRPIPAFVEVPDKGSCPRVGAHDQVRASDSPRPISRFSPKRIRFDAVAHDAIMAVSDAFWWPTWASWRLTCSWSVCMDGWMDMREAPSSRALKRPSCSSRLRSPTPHQPSTPQTATVTACIPTIAAY